MHEELDVPELREWFNCSAALKKKKKKSIMDGSALLEVRKETRENLARYRQKRRKKSPVLSIRLVAKD